MSEIVELALLGGAVTVPVLAIAIYSEIKLRRRIDNKGDFVDKAYEDGPDEVIEDAIEHQSRQLHETEDNILRLSPREIFCLLGMDYNSRLSIESVEHRHQHPVVKIHVKERLRKFAPPPQGWYSTYARHTFDIEIPELDELLGEDVIAVEDEHGHLRAMGISAYEEETYEDSFGDEVRVYYEREWEEVDQTGLNPYGARFTIEEKRERIPNNDEVIWDDGMC